MYICISADPGLFLGRGGAWDHRRCGTNLLPCQAANLPKAPQQLPRAIKATTIWLNRLSKLPLARPQTLQRLLSTSYEPSGPQRSGLTYLPPCRYWGHSDLVLPAFENAV